MDETFSFFGAVFHWYGLIIGLSVLLGWRMAERGAGLLYVNKSMVIKDLEQSFWWMAVGGVLGARLYHVIDYWDYYQDRLSEVGQLWHGGLGIYGAMVGGVLGLVVWMRFGADSNRRARFWRVLDCVALGLPLAQAVGRMGNYINKEVYGRPTNLPWKVFIPVEKRMTDYEEVAYYHPLFWYEAAWCVIGFLGLWILVRKRAIQAGKGNYMVLYLGWYALGRIWLESLRIRSWNWEGIPIAMIIGVVIIGGAWWFYLLRKQKDEWAILDH